MLERSGDLIPVRAEAVQIPWTKRKSLVLNYLHRGPVTFDTYVYDTNVGDVSPLSAYFNPERWSVVDLNNRFGVQPQDDKPTEPAKDGEDAKSGEKVLVPKLLIYPDKQETPEKSSSSKDSLSSERSLIDLQMPSERSLNLPKTEETCLSSLSPYGSSFSLSSFEDHSSLGLRGIEENSIASLKKDLKQETIQTLLSQRLCHPLNESAMRRALLLDLCETYTPVHRSFNNSLDIFI